MVGDWGGEAGVEATPRQRNRGPGADLGEESVRRGARATGAGEDFDQMSRRQNSLCLWLERS